MVTGLVFIGVMLVGFITFCVIYNKDSYDYHFAGGHRKGVVHRTKSWER